MQNFVNPAIEEYLKNILPEFITSSLDEQEIMIGDIGITLVKPSSQAEKKYHERGMLLLPFGYQGVTVLYFPSK